MLRIIFILTGSLMITFLHAHDTTKQSSSKVFTKQQLLQDIDSLHLWLQQTHPQLYFHSDSALTEKRWAAVRRSLSDSLTAEAFETIISPLVSQYNDGHTYVDIDLESLQSKGKTLFPAVVLIHDNKLYIKDTIGTLMPGSEVISVNSINAETIIQQILSVVPGDYLQNKEATGSRLFTYYYAKYFGYQDSFSIKAKIKKQIIAAAIPGIHLESVYKQIFPSPLWTMKLYPEQELAIIECINYQGNMQRIRERLDSFFTIIKKTRIKHVALDLRRNGGGNSYIGNVFLSYVTQKPLNGLSAKIYRQSPQLLRMKDDEWPKSQFLTAMRTWQKEGDYYRNTFGADPLPVLTDTSLLFRGSFYLLTSPRTYSSAHITALQVKCSGLGRIIGEPTGEDINLTGEIIEMELPYTKIKVVCPVVMYKPACASSITLGVQPDVFVPFNKADFMNGIDSVVQVLLKIIKP